MSSQTNMCSLQEPTVIIIVIIIIQRTIFACLHFLLYQTIRPSAISDAQHMHKLTQLMKTFVYKYLCS